MASFLIKKPQGVKEFAEPIRKFIEYKADGGANMSDFLKTQAGSMATDFAGGLEPINFSDPNTVPVECDTSDFEANC